MSRLGLLALLFFALLAAACSTTTEVGADDPPGVTPTPLPPTSEPVPPAPSDPDTPREIPPLELPTTAPGSDEAYQAMIEELERFVTAEQLAEGVPWPDLRNPDPIAAYRSCAEFQQWMLENNASTPLVEAYTAPDSPERGWDVAMFADMIRADVLSTPNVPPYTMDVRGLVHPAATEITDALLEQVPEGSAAVVYWDSVGASQYVQPDGTIVGGDQGWSNLGPWVAIMAPTDVGWQVWWDELTEVPPPGLFDDRGLPTPDPDRPRDV